MSSKYSCCQCKQLFKSLYLLHQHNFGHLPPKRDGTARRRSVSAESTQDKMRPHGCEHCTFRFETVVALKLHYEIHHQDKHQKRNFPYRRSDASTKQRSDSARRPSENVIVTRDRSATRTETHVPVAHEKEVRSEVEKKENLPPTTATKNMVPCSRGNLMELERHARQVLADLENNNFSDGRSLVDALLRQKQLVQALAGAGTSSSKQNVDADSGPSVDDAKASAGSPNSEELVLVDAQRSDDGQPSSPEEGSSASSSGSSRRRAIRSKSITQEEQWRIDLSTVMDESHLFRVKGIVGDGLASDREFDLGDPVAEYRGDYITVQEAKQREKEYDAAGIKDCYQLCVQELCGRTMVIDPTRDLTCMARFLNHSHLAPNLEMRPAYVGGRVRAILYAKRFIPPGEELTFDYDDRRKAVVMAKPWLVET